MVRTVSGVCGVERLSSAPGTLSRNCQKFPKGMSAKCPVGSSTRHSGIQEATTKAREDPDTMKAKSDTHRLGLTVNPSRTNQAPANAKADLPGPLLRPSASE